MIRFVVALLGAALLAAALLLWRPTIKTWHALRAAADDDVLQIDMFRAMGGDGLLNFTESNDDLADLTGVLKYVHTEAIMESSHPPDAKTRKYGIDVIAGWRFLVQNNKRLLNDPDAAQSVDFGQFQAYDHGESTNKEWDKFFRMYGDFVGVQPYEANYKDLSKGDGRFPSYYPFYWTSISGFCPNKIWDAKGDPKDPDPGCIKQDATDKQLMGGLCPDGKVPTGQPGCIYNYSSHEYKIELDELVGITEELCAGGSRKCKDWHDFRTSCSNHELKFYFARNAANQSVKTRTPDGHCVEYDVHPDCVKDCGTEVEKGVPGPSACAKVPPEERELGLPFWRGRCSADSNRIRAEKVAKWIGIENAQTDHKLVFEDIEKNHKSCMDVNGHHCRPDKSSGGTYCSRYWAGICTNCYIPGTLNPYPANSSQPTCPLNILKIGGYSHGDYNPECKSQNPTDLCCFYLENECHGEMDPDKADLDEAGYAAARAKAARCTTGIEGESCRGTDVMARFLARVGADMGLGKYVKDKEALNDIAYWLWDANFIESNFSQVKEDLVEKRKELFTNTPPPPPGGNSSGFPWLVILPAIALIAAAGGIAVYFHRQKQRREQQQLLLYAQREPGSQLPSSTTPYTR